jgi:hypothetical protein
MLKANGMPRMLLRGAPTTSPVSCEIASWQREKEFHDGDKRVPRRTIRRAGNEQAPRRRSTSRGGSKTAGVGRTCGQRRIVRDRARSRCGAQSAGREGPPRRPRLREDDADVRRFGKATDFVIRGPRTESAGRRTQAAMLKRLHCVSLRSMRTALMSTTGVPSMASIRSDLQVGKGGLRAPSRDLRASRLQRHRDLHTTRKPCATRTRSSALPRATGPRLVPDRGTPNNGEPNNADVPRE